jgi:PadR family transcriptional regulator, regulatory protein PadR
MYHALHDTTLTMPHSTVTSFYDNWTVQVRKGVLELCILQSLAEGEHYGYSLVKALSGTRGLQVAEGTIYPLLARLKAEDLVQTRLVETSDGPARKYYVLTERGAAELAAMDAYFKAMVTAVEAIRQHGASPMRTP